MNVRVRVLLQLMIGWTVMAGHLSAHDSATPPEGRLCVVGNRPAATLLIPWFEVDLGDPGGVGTLLAVGNASPEPTAARVAIWSDWGIPVLSFDVYLGAHALQTINLRDVLVAGRLPTAGPPQPLVGCSDPLAGPDLDAAALASLQAKLTGQPEPSDGLCYSSTRGDDRVAVGWITVDAVNSCSPTPRYPSDSGYFAPDGSGLASNRNVLWGEVFYLDPAGEAAQGFDAVALVADHDYFASDEGRFDPTFYGRLGDDRVPLSSTYRTRFFHRTGFDGGTELIVWIRAFRPPELAVPCGEQPDGAEDFFVKVRVTGEDGALPPFQISINPRAMALKLQVGEAPLEVAPSAGVMEVEFFWTDVDAVTLPPAGREQGWLMPILTAGERFSVGLRAMRADDTCVW